MDMNDQNDANEVRPPVPTELGSDAREQIRDWEFLFWAFLLFGLGRLAWLYLYQIGRRCQRSKTSRPNRAGQRCARADSRLGVSLLGFPPVRLGSAGVALSLSAREQRLSLGTLVRGRVRS